MKRIWLVLALVSLGFAAYEQQEAYPGQSEHKEPPKDWMCSNHPNAPKDHKCACERKCTKPIDEEGNEIPGPLVVNEDPKCSVWCHADHCACAIKCGDTH